MQTRTRTKETRFRLPSRVGGRWQGSALISARGGGSLRRRGEAVGSGRPTEEGDGLGARRLGQEVQRNGEVQNLAA